MGNGSRSFATTFSLSLSFTIASRLLPLVFFSLLRLTDITIADITVALFFSLPPVSNHVTKDFTGVTFLARQLQLPETEPGCFVTRTPRVFFMAHNFYAFHFYGYRVAAMLNCGQEIFTWENVANVRGLISRNYLHWLIFKIQNVLIAGNLSIRTKDRLHRSLSTFSLAILRRLYHWILFFNKWEEIPRSFNIFLSLLQFCETSRKLKYSCCGRKEV